MAIDALCRVSAINTALSTFILPLQEGMDEQGVYFLFLFYCIFSFTFVFICISLFIIGGRGGAWEGKSLGID